MKCRHFARMLFVISFVLTIQGHKFCRTPHNFNGQCVDIKRCLIFNGGHRRNSRYENILKNSTCENSDEKVCCRRRHIRRARFQQISTDDVSKLNSKNCGKINPDNISRGNQTLLGEFPFIVRLEYREEDNSTNFKCGGSLIIHRYVLTAAHCITDELFSVRLGEHTVDQDPDCHVLTSGKQKCAPPVKDFNIQEKIKHSRFSKEKKINDIALIRLREPVSLNNIDYINTINLPLDSDLKLKEDEDKLLVAGWGRDESLRTTRSLMQAVIPRQHIQKCRETFNLNNITNSTIICAGGKDLVDTCQGDSGGPLFLRGERFIQYGVTAAGFIYCGRLWKGETPPALYTNIDFYIDWIINNIELD